MKSKKCIRYIVSAINGDFELGKPLPIKATAGDLHVIPIAEVTEDVLETKPQHYSLAKIAAISGVSLSTIKREIDDERLKSFKVRGRRMVALEEALKYWESVRDSESKNIANKSEQDRRELPPME